MRVLFMGRKNAGAQCLEWLCAQGHEIVAVLTDSHLAGSPTAMVARSLGLRLITLEEASEAIRDNELTFDLGVSVVYWRIVPESIIREAPLGIINFHPAPLPDYKGTAGYNVAILDALEEWGVTAHYIDAGVDSGPIIEVDRFAIDPTRETAQSLESTSMIRLVAQLQRVIRAVVAKKGILSTSPNVGGTYISRKEMEQMKVVKPGDDVDRKVRAFWFPPYSGATVLIDGKSYTLVNQQILETIATQTDAFSTSLISPSSDTTV